MDSCEGTLESLQKTTTTATQNRLTKQIRDYSYYLAWYKQLDKEYKDNMSSKRKEKLIKFNKQKANEAIVVFSEAISLCQWETKDKEIVAGRLELISATLEFLRLAKETRGKIGINGNKLFKEAIEAFVACVQQLPEQKQRNYYIEFLNSQAIIEFYSRNNKERSFGTKIMDSLVWGQRKIERHKKAQLKRETLELIEGIRQVAKNLPQAEEEISQQMIDAAEKAKGNFENEQPGDPMQSNAKTFTSQQSDASFPLDQIPPHVRKKKPPPDSHQPAAPGA